jgi:hypothetical protein
LEHSEEPVIDLEALQICFAEALKRECSRFDRCLADRVGSEVKGAGAGLWRGDLRS